MYSSASASSLAVVTPGRTFSSRSAIVPATIWPARAIVSISACDLRMIMPPPPPPAPARGGNPASPTNPLRAAADAKHRRIPSGEPAGPPEPPQRGMTSSCRGPYPLERFFELTPHGLDRPLRVQRHELSGDAVVLHDRLRLGVVDLEPPLDHLGRVVVAALEPRALERPLDADRVGDVEEEDRVERLADAREHLVERPRLRQVAREAVQHEPLDGVGLAQPLPDQRDRQLVGDELAGGEDRRDLPAELRASVPRRAEHVAGRDVRDAVLRGDTLRLRSLAGALAAKDEQVHLRVPI